MKRRNRNNLHTAMYASQFSQVYSEKITNKLCKLNTKFKFQQRVYRVAQLRNRSYKIDQSIWTQIQWIETRIINKDWRNYFKNNRTNLDHLHSKIMSTLQDRLKRTQKVNFKNRCFSCNKMLTKLNKRCKSHFNSFGENPKFWPTQCSTKIITITQNNSFWKNSKVRCQMYYLWKPVSNW